MASRGTGAKSAYGRLDRPVIVEAALRLTARPGTIELRFRDLGLELGADPTAVYRHFRNKGQLMAALIERLMDEVAGEVRSKTGSGVGIETGRGISGESDRGADGATGYRALLEAQASAIFEVFGRHPAVGIHLADARPVGPNELTQAELSVGALESAGLEGPELIDLYGTLSGFALSYVATTCWQLAGQGTVQLDDVPWFPESATVTELSHPSLARNGGALAAMDFRSTYFTGIRVLLDLVDAAAARKAK